MRGEQPIVWDRWIAIGFAIGSLCFLIGPFPGFVQLVGEGPDAVVFFVGSIFFTLAAGTQLWQAGRHVSDQRIRDLGWLSAAIQFAGTLFFNRSTYNAMQEGLDTSEVDRLVWTPDLLGSIAFLVSGMMAYRVATRGRLLPERRDRDWWMNAINLAGCVFFMISAIAAYVVPSTGSVLDLAAANFTTALGGLCFFVGAVLLYPNEATTAVAEPSGASSDHG